MNTLKEYISEKLQFNKENMSTTLNKSYDSLMQAVMNAKKLSLKNDKNYIVYKTKNNKYIAAINQDNYKVGDSFEDNTVVEVINKK